MTNKHKPNFIQTYLPLALLMLLFIGLTLARFAIKDQQDTRSQAASDSGSATIQLNGQTNNILPDRDHSFQMHLNTQDNFVDCVQVFGTFTANLNNPDESFTMNYKSSTPVGLSLISEKLEKTSDTEYDFELVFITQNPLAPFSTNSQPKNITEFTVNQQSGTTIDMTFNQSLSKVCLTSVGDDILKTIDSTTLSFATAPTPTITPTPTPTATATTTPTPTPTATATTTPTPTPTPTATTQLIIDNSCSGPSTPQSLSAYALGSTSILLEWEESSGATNYSILYGESPGNFIYGAANIGTTKRFVVNSLQPNTLYYFAVFASNDCSTSGRLNVSQRTTSGSQQNANSTNNPPIGGAVNPTPTTSPSPSPSITPSPSPITTKDGFVISKENLDTVPSTDDFDNNTDVIADTNTSTSDQTTETNNAPTNQADNSEESGSNSTLLFFGLGFLLVPIIGLIIFLVKKKQNTPPDPTYMPPPQPRNPTPPPPTETPHSDPPPTA